MKLVRTILQKCSVLHLLSSDKLMAQGCIGSFSLKTTIANLLTSTNKEYRKWHLAGRQHSFNSEEKLYLLDGNFDECISPHAQLKNHQVIKRTSN